MLENRQCRFSGTKEETINYIISKCNKLTQKEYKSRDAGVVSLPLGSMKAIELWYMNRLDSV